MGALDQLCKRENENKDAAPRNKLALKKLNKLFSPLFALVLRYLLQPMNRVM